VRPGGLPGVSGQHAQDGSIPDSTDPASFSRSATFAGKVLA
jgi:hypothetical protein